MRRSLIRLPLDEDISRMINTAVLVLLTVILLGNANVPADKSRVLPAPEGLQSTATQGGVSLEWQPVSGAGGYIVMRSDTQRGTPTILAVLDESDTAYTDKNPPQTAWYKVAAHTTTFSMGGETATSLAEQP